jgi:hypothetical protein
VSLTAQGEERNRDHFKAGARGPRRVGRPLKQSHGVKDNRVVHDELSATLFPANLVLNLGE